MPVRLAFAARNGRRRAMVRAAAVGTPSGPMRGRGGPARAPHGDSTLSRWLLLPLGLAIALAALLALATGRAPHPRPVASGPPLDRIDAASRAQLEKVLREADRAAPPPGSRR
jgi:hypothetical protein